MDFKRRILPCTVVAALLMLQGCASSKSGPPPGQFPPAPTGKLVANEAESAQELTTNADKSLCTGRGKDCSVLLDVPKDCAGTSVTCPIAIFFHGHGGSSTQFVKNAVTDLVHQHSFIGVYPQGVEYGDGQTGWNDGSMEGNVCAWDDFDCDKDPNEGYFLTEIIKALRKDGAQGRIYLWGGSNGANNAQIMAANAGDDLPISGISVGWGQLLATPERSGPVPFDWNQPASPGTTGRPGDGRKIAQQSQHGDADTIIPYEGGSRFESDVYILMTEAESDKTWAQHNGCTGSLEQPHNFSATTRTEETKAIFWQYTGCPEVAPVEYYQLVGTGHGGAETIDGKDPFNFVFDFFMRVEKASATAERQVQPNIVV